MLGVNLTKKQIYYPGSINLFLLNKNNLKQRAVRVIGLIKYY